MYRITESEFLNLRALFFVNLILFCSSFLPRVFAFPRPNPDSTQLSVCVLTRNTTQAAAGQGRRPDGDGGAQAAAEEGGVSGQGRRPQPGPRSQHQSAEHWKQHRWLEWGRRGEAKARQAGSCEPASNGAT